MRVALSVVFGALAMLTLSQQRQTCELDVKTAPGSVSRRVLTGDRPRIEVGGGVEATCGAMWVRADSASYYEDPGILYLFRNVRYREGSRRLQADRATYYQAEDWVRAEGRVRLEDEADGSTLTGPVLEYYPASASRPLERMFAPSRPHLTFYPDSGGARAASPFDVDADRIHIYGDSAIAAAGEVEAVRGDLDTFSDSMDLDMGQGRLWLLGDPRVVSSDLTLLGDSILVLLEENRVSEILAWPDASATGSELALEAPQLRFFVDGGEVVRAVASGEAPEAGKAVTPREPGDTLAPAAARRPRPGLEGVPPMREGAARRPESEAEDTLVRAGTDSLRQEEGGPGAAALPISGPPARSISEDFVLVADSIDIDLPAGQVETVVAVGRARAASREMIIPGDELLGRDWLEGDTITGHFEPLGATTDPGESPDTGRQETELRRLVAQGDARALYHLRDEGEEKAGTNHPAINYVIGRQITLWVEGGQVREARVIGPATGTYLEPLPRVPDSLAAPPDTSGVPAPGDSVVAPDSSVAKLDSTGTRVESGLSKPIRDPLRRID